MRDKIGVKKVLFLHSKGKTVRRRCQNTPKKARQNVSQGSTGPFLGLLPVRTERSKRVIGLKMPKNGPFLTLQANYPLNGIHRQLGYCPLGDPKMGPKSGFLWFLRKIALCDAICGQSAKFYLRSIFHIMFFILL